MPRRLLHLSDLHLNADAVPDEGVDADRSLQLVLEACQAIPDINAVIVTGDIADDGSVPAYERAHAALLDFARGRGAALVMAVGNHDDRDAFSAVLGTGHFVVRDDQTAHGPEGVITACTRLDGWRVVTLDSLVPGKGFGRIGDDQLQWLIGLLDAEPLTPTVLALHHPPIDLGVEIQQRFRLESSDRLAAAVQHGTVAAILCGHFHQQISASLAGVPIWVTPGVLNRIDHLTVPLGQERAVTGGGATIVDLTDPGAPTFATVAARDPQAGREIYTMTSDEVAEMLDRSGLPAGR
ncbi:MAG: metallophosphoesterase [Propionibacteriales bacterium]|nr:metallophosphoesterase [Propionibacteriales bacterium]